MSEARGDWRPEERFKRCAGFDENGKAFRCPNPPGTPWTPAWCSECDERRRARLSQQFQSLVDGLRDAMVSDEDECDTYHDYLSMPEG